MARALNKNRMNWSRIVIAAAVLIILFTREITKAEGLTHSTLDFFGYVLIVLCGMGRLYATAYLGGRKNTELVTWGPFSVVRNPLYVCSWLGFTGCALCSNNLWVILLIPASFAAIYLALVRREEEFLRQQFGQAYAGYCARTPRFIPRFSGFTQPAEITLTTHQFKKGFWDNIWWFAVPPGFEFLEILEHFR